MEKIQCRKQENDSDTRRRIILYGELEEKKKSSLGDKPKKEIRVYFFILFCSQLKVVT